MPIGLVRNGNGPKAGSPALIAPPSAHHVQRSWGRAGANIGALVGRRPGRSAPLAADEANINATTDMPANSVFRVDVMTAPFRTTCYTPCSACETRLGPRFDNDSVTRSAAKRAARNFV